MLKNYTPVDNKTCSQTVAIKIVKQNTHRSHACSGKKWLHLSVKEGSIIEACVCVCSFCSSCYTFTEGTLSSKSR